MGNYDDGVGFDREECGCAYTREEDRVRGDASLRWTRAEVTDDNKQFLQRLAPQLRTRVGAKRVLLVHGSPRRMNEYLFEDRPDSSFQRLAEGSEADLIAFGHTHKPYVKVVGEVTFLNIGSVGKPKDRDPRACFALVTESTTEFVRVSYDVATAAAAIRATTLPEQFARDIETGGIVVRPSQSSQITMPVRSLRTLATPARMAAPARSRVNASGSNDEAVSGTSRPRDDAPRQIAAVTFTVGSGSCAPTTRNCWSR